MPRRATRAPLDDLSSLDRGNPVARDPNTGELVNAEDVLDTAESMIPSLEGIARIFGVNLNEQERNGNDWAAVVQRMVQMPSAPTRTRTRRVQRDAIDRYRREANPIPVVRRSLIDVPTSSEDVEANWANEDLRGNASVDKTTTTRKLKGKIVICQKAMNGACPVLIERAETEDVSELDVWCIHMVPHAHRENMCDDSYDRERTLPKTYLKRVSCRMSKCNPMEPVPEHRRWQKKEKKSTGPLPHHKRTLIIE